MRESRVVEDDHISKGTYIVPDDALSKGTYIRRIGGENDGKSKYEGFSNSSGSYIRAVKFFQDEDESQ